VAGIVAMSAEAHTRFDEEPVLVVELRNNENNIVESYRAYDSAKWWLQYFTRTLDPLIVIWIYANIFLFGGEWELAVINRFEFMV